MEGRHPLYRIPGWPKAGLDTHEESAFPLSELGRLGRGIGKGVSKLGWDFLPGGRESE